MNDKVSSFPRGYRSRSPIRSTNSQLDQVTLAIAISQRRSTHREDHIRTDRAESSSSASKDKIIDGKIDGSKLRMGSKIINPITKRKIKVGKITYKKLIKKGIIIDYRFKQ